MMMRVNLLRVQQGAVYLTPARLMAFAKKRAGIPVKDEDGKLIGLVSDLQFDGEYLHGEYVGDKINGNAFWDAWSL